MRICECLGGNSTGSVLRFSLEQTRIWIVGEKRISGKVSSIRFFISDQKGHAISDLNFIRLTTPKIRTCPPIGRFGVALTCCFSFHLVIHQIGRFPWVVGPHRTCSGYSHIRFDS
jgi:hypothetical protein